MDLATLVGVISGVVLIAGAILLGGSLGDFIDIPSMAIVLGGSTAALLITFPLSKVKAVFGVTRKVLQAGKLEVAPWYHTIVELATIARRDGVLALEERLPDISDEFLRRGLQMMVDGNAPDAVSAILQQEIENMESRHSVGQAIWGGLGNYAPAFGMIGTLVGLVQMLKNMSDPSTIGSGMAVALITTFYGAVIANLFCIPIKGKLEQRSDEELQLKRMLLAGIMSIQAGDSPRIVGEKLLVYLAPAERAKITEGGK